MSLKESNEVRVKDEPISYNQSISQTIKATSKKVKEEPIDNEMQTSQIESNSEMVEIKAEEKFSATEEFANKASIAFLNEETSATTSDNNPINNQATTSKSQQNKTRKKKTNKLKKSK